LIWNTAENRSGCVMVAARSQKSDCAAVVGTIFAGMNPVMQSRRDGQRDGPNECDTDHPSKPAAERILSHRLATFWLSANLRNSFLVLQRSSRRVGSGEGDFGDD
jgi:hypothetical protein